MKRMRIISTVLFFMLFAALAFAAPQQDEPKEKSPEKSPAMQHPSDKPEAKPESQEQRPDEMKSEKNDQEKPDKKAEKNEDKANKEQEKEERKEDKKSDKHLDNMHNQNEAHGRPAGKGGHIPDDKFRSHFGKQHTFHPSRPTVVNGQPTFVYGGYSFIMVEPWPAEWAYSDDCYIDYVDGEYFLFDVLHPGVRIALFVSM